MRKLFAVAIALCLFLPLRSCTTGGETTIYFPLSGYSFPADLQNMLLMSAIYLLPLLTLAFGRHRIASLLAGVSACLAGLYFVSYTSTLWASHLLPGWYVYTVCSLGYLFASAKALRQHLNEKIEAPPPLDP